MGVNPEINVNKLYREDYGTFEEYCREPLCSRSKNRRIPALCPPARGLPVILAQRPQIFACCLGLTQQPGFYYKIQRQSKLWQFLNIIWRNPNGIRMAHTRNITVYELFCLSQRALPYRTFQQKGKKLTHGQIKYRLSYEKAIEALVWLAHEQPGMDVYHVAKILFYAEKLHINRHAKPIIGDTYICMDYGPVPSGVRDLITQNPWLNPDHLMKFKDAILVGNEPNTNISTNRKPDMGYFSKTDIECLQEALSEYGPKSFGELKDLTHNEVCWLDTMQNQPIDYELMVDESNPHRNRIIEEMAETSAYVVV